MQKWFGRGLAIWLYITFRLDSVFVLEYENPNSFELVLIDEGERE